MNHDYVKSYMYLKGFAQAKEFRNTEIALALAERFHEGQFRKGDGKPYITHPLKVCSHLVCVGVLDDITLAAALLHDVAEDCVFESDCNELVTKYGLAQEVLDVVKLVTKEKGYIEKDYYDCISRDKRAILIKIADRAHNLSTMVNAFSESKMISYIEESYAYIFPLIKLAKVTYPEISNQVTALKFQMTAVCDTINGFCNMKKN